MTDPEIYADLAEAKHTILRSISRDQPYEVRIIIVHAEQHIDKEQGEIALRMLDRESVSA